MNKFKFLSRLNDLLQELNEEDRNDILNFYYERFDMARYEGKSDQQLINELESVEVIARNVLAEYGEVPLAAQVKGDTSLMTNVDKNPTANNLIYNNVEDHQAPKSILDTTSMMRKIAPANEDSRKTKRASFSKVIALIIVDILFLSSLVPALWSIPFSIFTAGLATFPFSAILPLNYDFIDWFPTSLAYIGAGLILILLAFAIGKLVLKIMKKIIILHVKVCAPNSKEMTIEKIKNWHAFRRFKNERRKRVFTGLISFLGIGLIVSGVITMVTMNSAYYRMVMGTYRYSLEPKVLENLELSDSYDLNLSTGSANMKIDFIVHDESYLKVEYDYDYSYGDLTAEVVDNQININLETEIKKWWDYAAVIRPYDAKLTVNVPNNLNIANLKVTGEDSRYDFNNASFNSLNIDTKNSVVNLNRMTVINDINVVSSNGKLIVNNTTASTLNLRTSNSKIVVNNTQAANDITLTTSNSKIDVSNIRAGKDVTLTTSNSRIVASSIKAENLFATTSNARVKLNNCTELTKVVVKTSNSRIDLNEVYAKEVDLRTSNGRINYRNNDASYQVDQITAITTNGRIRINVNYKHLTMIEN